MPISPIPTRAFDNPDQEIHVSLGKPIRALMFLIPMGILAVIVFTSMTVREPRAIPIIVLVGVGILWGIIVSGIRLAAQWERGVVLRLGRFSSVKGPGVLYIIPFIDYVRFIDTRILTLNIPNQRVITKDNVPAEIDGALFFMVSDPGKAVISIQDYRFAIAQYAQASLRDVVGGLSLDDLLTDREQIQQKIKAIVDDRVREWGTHVDSVRLLDINMPEELKKMMSRQASAEREKRATITKAEGDKIAAINLSHAAATMLQSPGAMQLRTLQTIDGLGAGPSNTVIMFPVDLLESLKHLAASFNKAKPVQSEQT